MSDVKVIDDSGPAFPRVPTITADLCVEGSAGMSLRDYFAAAALQGLMANQDMMHQIAVSGEGDSGVAKVCFRAADAMLAARLPSP